ncbi:tyrosine-type recombinase/integrase [Sneathiella sp. HT1-7]|uniref:tyrosine-type recombinase/integrase n=1 Tax=Sneathiella sp. HT1-7 TaxID=2887192 RepID=UPI001D14AF68|nr:site-specific integrase [Sneathiella sp. HT1-7]MCC3304203.1 integrase arm-type DNA-binding domain-containing protein [Sneathiella sp. HT1-7]
MNKLSAVQIKALSGRGRYADGGNLYFQISEFGTKAWIFRFTRNKKSRSMGLGPYPDISLAKAREMAQECREKVRNGLDPIEERKAARQALYADTAKTITFRECADKYIDARSPEWKNIKHLRQWSATLEKYVFPVFGALPVKDVDMGLVLKALEPIWTTKTETASRVRQRIEKILDWAKVRKYREGENPARWHGNLDMVLPSPSKIQKIEHFKALPYEDVAAFVSLLRKKDSYSAMGLELIILTACRTGSLINAKWEDFNFDKKEWIIPAENMKAGKEHRVPLSPAVIAVLEKLLAVRQNEYVLPGANGKGHASNMALLQLIKRMGYGGRVTPHGFRSTFKDWASERTAYPNEVSEMALAHSVGNKVEAAYRRGDLFDKRKRIMDDWAEYCSKPESENVNNVIEIRG